MEIQIDQSFHVISSFCALDRLRGFLSIDIDVSELYINQCDMNNNQFYSENHYSNFRNNKSPDHQLTPLQPPSSFHLDNEIDAFHDSHKCHRHSMDVSKSKQKRDCCETI
jgi:hypothetical protein